MNTRVPPWAFVKTIGEFRALAQPRLADHDEWMECLMSALQCDRQEVALHIVDCAAESPCVDFVELRDEIRIAAMIAERESPETLATMKTVLAHVESRMRK